MPAPKDSGKALKPSSCNNNEAAATVLLSTQNVQFFSVSYDALVKSESSLSKALDNFSHRLHLFTDKVDRTDKAIDEML